MLNAKIRTVSGSVINGEEHGETNTEALDEVGGNPDRLYDRFSNGNDLGYVGIQYPSEGPLCSHPVYRPFWMPTQVHLRAPSQLVVDRTRELAHLVGEQHSLLRMHTTLCAAIASAPKDGKTFRPFEVRHRTNFMDDVKTLLNRRFTPGAPLNDATLRKRIAQNGSNQRCVRCYLTTVHPMLHFTQPNRFVGTLTFVHRISYSVKQSEDIRLRMAIHLYSKLY